MDKDACLDVLKARIGQKANFTDEELRGIVSDIDRRVSLRREQGVLESLEDSILSVTGEVSKEIKTDAIMRQRTAAINAIRRETLRQRISTYTGQPAEALKSILVGTNTGKAGARESVDAAFRALSRQYTGGIIADLRKAGLLELFTARNDNVEMAVARELWEIRPGGEPGISGSAEAKQIAQIVHKWQAVQVNRLNRAGAYIKELKGYIVRQSHDFRKLSRAGFDKWYDFVIDKIDMERTLGGSTNPREDLEKIYWDLVKGKHLETPPEELIKLNSIPDIAEKASQHREIHFNSALSWYEYNKTFGRSSLSEAVYGAADHAARNTALMESFGPEPEGMFKTLLNDLLSETKDPKAIADLQGRTGKGWMLQNYFREISGGNRALSDNAWFKGGRIWRSLNSLSKLGLATISAITDVATQAAELKYQGMGFLESYASAFNNIVQGRRSGWQREFADYLGVGTEGILGDIYGRFTTEDVPGALTRAMQIFFKMNGLSWWTDAHKTGSGLMLSRHLANHADLPFEQLPKELSRGLSMYGIKSPEWELLRKFTVEADDGRKLLSPMDVRNLTGAEIKEAFGEKVRPREIERIKDRLETAFRSYLVDRVDYAVLTPGAAESAISTLGTQAGTPLGEAIRMTMQFKQFTITGMTKALGRALYGNEGKADFMGLVHLMVATTALGYVAMAAKDAVKGKTPRDPKDPNTLAAAFVQGGGAGIMGDFLLGEYSRFGTSLVASATGPWMGQVNELGSLYSAFRDGDDAAARAVKFMINNTPGINLAYTRPALDYLFLYALQEHMNPGYLRRMERRIQKENHQTFLLPPSQFALGRR